MSKVLDEVKDWKKSAQKSIEEAEKRIEEETRVEELSKETEAEGPPTKKPDRHLNYEDVKQVKLDMTRMEGLRSDSGNVEFSDTLTTFFYLLLRDHLPAGKVEMIIHEVVNGADSILFTNGYLAQYADNLASALKSVKVNTLAKALESAFDAKGEKVKQPKRKSPVTGLSDPEELQKLKDKVDQAIEGMTDEQKDEWDDRMEHALDDALEKPPVRDVLLKGKDVGITDLHRAGQDHVSTINKQEQDEDAGDQTTEKDSIAKSLAALNDLKELVPSANIKQIVEILKQEVNSELSEDTDEDVQTRETILEERVKEHEEHKATNEEAKQAAEEFVKEQVEEALMTEDVDEQDEQPVSRGKLKDVNEGKAFPEALDKVFEDNPQKETGQAEELKKVMSTFRKHPGLFQRVE